MKATDLDRMNHNISTQDLAIYMEAGFPEKSSILSNLLAIKYIDTFWEVKIQQLQIFFSF